MLYRYYVYDFALPLLVLHALLRKTAMNLRNWMQICPQRQITVLDTHDGNATHAPSTLCHLHNAYNIKAVSP